MISGTGRSTGLDDSSAFLTGDPCRAELVGGREPLSRSVEIRPATWRPWLEQGGHTNRGTKYSLPEQLSRTAAEVLGNLRPSESRHDRTLIDRQFLVDLSTAAAHGTDAPLIQLWVATMMWGSGTSNGRGPWRAAQGLADERLTSTLQATLPLARAGELVDAFRSWHLSGCGEAFFTKWFWACSLTSSATPKPLILDLRVRNAIASAISNQTLKLRGAAGYAAYCIAMQQVASQLADKPDLGHIDAEKVEWLLFERAPGAFYAWLGSRSNS